MVFLIRTITIIWQPPNKHRASGWHPLDTNHPYVVPLFGGFFWTRPRGVKIPITSRVTPWLPARRPQTSIFALANFCLIGLHSRMQSQLNGCPSDGVADTLHWDPVFVGGMGEEDGGLIHSQSPMVISWRTPSRQWPIRGTLRVSIWLNSGEGNSLPCGHILEEWPTHKTHMFCDTNEHTRPWKLNCMTHSESSEPIAESGGWTNNPIGQTPECDWPSLDYSADQNQLPCDHQQAHLEPPVSPVGEGWCPPVSTDGIWRQSRRIEHSQSQSVSTALLHRIPMESDILIFTSIWSRSRCDQCRWYRPWFTSFDDGDSRWMHWLLVWMCGHLFSSSTPTIDDADSW